MKDVVQAAGIAVTIAILCECVLIYVRQLRAEERRNREGDQ